MFIPYFQTSRYRVEAMLELAKAVPGQKMADLGSGDGRIVISFAKKGVESYGFEMDEGLRALSLVNISKEDLKNAFIQGADFWKEDLSDYDIITVYGMPDAMDMLSAKLKKELKKGAKVLSNYYLFPDWKYVAKKDNIYLYIIP